MSDHNTYRLTVYHCPLGCGHKATQRAVETAGHQKCPRCKGSSVSHFLPDTAWQSQALIREVANTYKGM